MKKGLLLLLLTVFVLAMTACDATVSEMNVGGIGVSGDHKPSWEEMIGQDGTQPSQQGTVPVETQDIIVIRPTEETEPSMSRLEYWIENCDVRYLSNNDLYGLSQEEARIARNAIYAKSGRMFRDEALNAFFGTYDWYIPRYSAEYFSDDMLSDVQSHNLELVIAYESRWK